MKLFLFLAQHPIRHLQAKDESVFISTFQTSHGREIMEGYMEFGGGMLVVVSLVLTL